MSYPFGFHKTHSPSDDSTLDNLNCERPAKNTRNEHYA